MSLFIAIEITIIVRNSEFFVVFYKGHLLASNFLWRFPKIDELLLYSYASLIMNDPYYIRADPNTYKNSVYCNFNKIVGDLEDNSFYKLYGESNFAFLFYQISIMRQNIARSFLTKKKLKALSLTIENGLAYKKSDLCFHSSYTYCSSLNEDMQYIEYFSQISYFTTTCREIGNGMNLSGIDQVLETMLQQLLSLYINFISSTSDDRSLTFIEDPQFLLILKNNNILIARLNSSYGNSILTDINSFIKSEKKEKIFLSIISIFFSYGVILAILWTILLKIDQYNKILRRIIHIFNNFTKNIEV